MRLKSFRFISLVLTIVLLFACSAGMQVFADKDEGKGQLGGGRIQTEDRIQLRDKDNCGINCVRDEDCDGIPDRDRLQKRDRDNSMISLLCDPDCDGTPDMDRIRLRINWDTTEVPADTLLQLDNQLITLKELEENLRNTVASKNKNAADEIIKQLEREMLKFREMLKNFLEDEVPDDELDEWIRQRFQNREFHRFMFRWSVDI